MEKKHNKQTRPTAKPAVVAETKKKGMDGKFLILGGLVVIIIAAAFILKGKMGPTQKESAFETPTDTSAVVAVIDGEEIHLSKLQGIKNAIPQLRDIPMETVYNNLLEGYVNSRVILKAAQNAGIQDRSEVQKVIEDAKEQIVSRAYLAEQLQKRMSQEKIKAIYEEELKKYVPQDEIHARHILVATEKEAKDLIVKLKNGAKFEDLANKHSLDKNPNAETGGDLGYFKKEMMIPEFGNAAFAIEVGKISEKPVKTPFGWHVIKVEDKRKAAPPTMADMQELLTAKFEEVTLPEIFADERAKMQVKLLDPLGVNKASAKAEEQKK